MDASAAFGSNHGFVQGVYAAADGRTQQQQHQQQQQVHVQPWNSVQQAPHFQRKPAQPKTPISLLQEACLRKKITPHYELLSSEGQVHEPTFKYKCVVGDLQAVGVGRSKKYAKHMSAKNLLGEVIRLGVYSDWFIPGRNSAEALSYLQSLLPPEKKREAGATAAVKNGESEKENSIGKLQQKCSKQRWPSPEYKLLQEQGAAHDRVFTIQIKLGKLTAQSEAKSKKEAKRKAADEMIKLIAKTNEAECFDEDELSKRFRKVLKSFGQPALSGKDKAAIQSFFGPLIGDKAGEGMRSLKNKQDGLPAMKGPDYKRLLSRVAEESKFPVSYRDLTNLNPQGEKQCLVQLSTMPVAVCLGTGPNQKEAQYAAARNALEYLRIMATNPMK